MSGIDTKIKPLFLYLNELYNQIQLNMKKNILIVVLLIISTLLLVYSFIKADEADKERVLAEMKHLEVVELRKENEELQATAQAAAKEAREQALRAQEALAECQSNN